MKNRRILIPIITMVTACAALSSAGAQGTGTAISPDAATPPSTATTVTPSPGVTISTNKSAPPHSQPYTVVKGDSLTKLAVKFNTTRKKLEALNDLSSYKLTPGQVIFVPASAKKSATAAAAAAKKKLLAAAPVQDYDIPASTFASCPVPPSNDDDSDIVATYGKAPPIAPLVSPSEMQADQERQQREAAEAAQAAAQERLTATIAPPRLSLPPETDVASTSTVTPVVKPKTKAKAKPATTLATTVGTGTATPQKIVPSPAPSGWANASSHPMNSARPRPSALTRMWNSITSPGSGDANMASRANDPSNAWGYKFLTASRELGDRGIDYDDNWRPPGEHSSWVMDCSNTSRWLYKSVAGINLPRTASDQYYYLHLQGKAWDVPKDGYGLPDVTYLQENLKPGDLLFWENTYKPERSPPITHVMVYLGTNDKGQWIMSGSQSSRGGEHNRRNGGPDVYVFRPSQPCGGWAGWFGTNRHVGRFCAFGRPLEADPSKLAVND